MLVQKALGLPPICRVICGKTGKLKQVADRALAFLHGVPQSSQIDHRIGDPRWKLPRILGRGDGMRQDPFETLDG